MLLHWKSLHKPPTELPEGAVTASGVFWCLKHLQSHRSLCLSKHNREWLWTKTKRYPIRVSALNFHLQLSLPPPVHTHDLPAAY